MSLDFAELPASVRKLWDGVVPPLVETAVAFVLLGVVCGPAVSFTFLSNLDPNQLLPPPKFREAMEFYGLTTVVPVFVLIGILVGAHGVERAVWWFSRFVPGYLTLNSTQQFFAAADEWRWRRLWVCHPDFDDVNTINALDFIIEDEISRAAADPLGTSRLKWIQDARNRAGRYHDRIVFAKGLIALSVVTGIVAASTAPPISPYIGRVLLVIATLVTWIFVNARLYVASEQELCRSKIDCYLQVKTSRLPDGGEPLHDTAERDAKRLERFRQSRLGGDIWTFQLARNANVPPAEDHVARAVAAFWRRLYARVRGQGKVDKQTAG